MTFKLANIELHLEPNYEVVEPNLRATIGRVAANFHNQECEDVIVHCELFI